MGMRAVIEGRGVGFALAGLQPATGETALRCFDSAAHHRTFSLFRHPLNPEIFKNPKRRHFNMQAAIDYIQSKINGFVPSTGLVLGSGLGFFADDRMKETIVIPYEEIPNFPRSTVEGHKGNFVFGKVDGHNVICMQGRFHYYEGYPMSEVIKPIRIMAKLGVKTLIVTNAAGGINRSFQEGTLMLITDHINFLGTNPLIGPNEDTLGTRFPDMSTAYDPDLREKAEAVAGDIGIALDKGVYLATTGPSYETPAEIRAFETLGADAVGMSTVPECITANHAGLKVCGISCITNKAAGISDKPLSHEEVAETANRVQNQFADLLERLIPAFNVS